MKKTLIAAVVLALILLLAPNAFGRFAESRSDAALDALLEQVPYLTVTERSWDRGWFTSRQQVTFESRLPAADVPRPRFTVHNDVLHGPVLGLSGIGAARVKTRVDLPAGTRAMIRETFGEEPALEMTTRLGFSGGGSTTLRSRGRTLTGDDGAEVHYDTARVEVDFSRNIREYEFDGRVPRIEVRGTNGQHMVFDRLTLEGGAERIDGFEHLYDSEFDLRLRELVSEGPEGDFRLEDVRYGVGMDLDEGLLSMRLRMGSDAIEGESLAASGLAIREMYYDLSLNRLHAQTMDAIYGAMQQSLRDMPYDAVDADPAGADEAISQGLIAPLAEHAGALLEHDPELAVDRIGFSTAEGQAVLKGIIRVVGMSGQEFAAAGLLGLLGRLQAELTLDIDEALAAKLPNGAFLSETGVAAGYLVRENGKLIARISFQNGALTVNGQTQSVPLPGAMPGGVMPGMEPQLLQ